MKKNFFFLLISVLVLLVSFQGAMAINLTDGLISYYKLDETSGTTASDSANTNDGTVNGATWVSGKINNGLSFDGTNDYVNIPSGDMISDWYNTEYSISAWIDVNDGSEHHAIYGEANSGTDNPYGVFRILYNKIELRIRENTNSYKTILVVSDNTISSGFKHVVLSVNDISANGLSNALKIYVDGISQNFTIQEDEWSSSTTHTLNTATIGALRRTSHLSFFDGLIDEVAIYDRALTSNEVEYLYNDDVGIQYPFIADKYVITAKNSFDDSSISNFSVSLNNTYNFSTTNGTININTSEVNGTYNILFFNNSFFNHTYENINVSDGLNLEGSLDFARINLNAKNIFEENTENFSYVVTNNTFTSTTYNSNTTNPINKGLYNFTFIKDDYYNLTQEINITGTYPFTTNKEITGVYNAKLEINASDIITNETYDNFTINIINNTNPNPLNLNQTTTNGSLIFNLMKDFNYDITINGSGISPQTQQLLVNETYQNFTFSIYKVRSIFFNFFNVETEELINTQNVSLDLISDIISFQNETSNGTLYMTLLEPESYIYRVNSEDYTTYFNSITVTEDTGETISVYMTPTNDSAQVEIRVIDELTSPVENAKITALRYSAQNNNYFTVGSVTTDNQGKAYFDLILNEEFYKFRIEYLGSTILDTEPRIIRNVDVLDGILLQVSLSPDLTDTFNKYRNIQTDLVYNNETQNFRLDFTNSLGTDITMCLVIDRPRILENNVFIGEECMTGSAGTLLFNYPLEDFTVRAKAITGGNVVDELTIYVPRAVSFGIIGLFIQLIITLSFVGFSLNSPKVMALMIGFSLLVGKFFNLHDLSYTTVWISLVLGLIVVYAMRDN